MKQTVIGIFDDASQAREAIADLQSAGFGTDSIDQSARSDSDSSMGGSKDNNPGTGTTAAYYDTNKSGGVGGFFKSLFGSDDDDSAATADRYTEVAGRSQSILTIHTDTEDRAHIAADILDRAGAVNVDERADQMGYSTNRAVGMGMGTNTEASGTMRTGTSAGTDATRLNIIEENLQVGKRTVETGGARLKARIVSRPVEENVRLREERVRVERNTVDRPATEADFQAFREGEVEIIEHAEVPIVSKEARVVGEVSLNKEVEERNETISDTVRRTEVEVEEIAGKDQRSSGTVTSTDNLNSRSSL